MESRTTARVDLIVCVIPPMYFKYYFKVFRTIQNTRESGKSLMLPKERTETVRKSFYCNGSKLFNDIPNELKDINSVMIFKLVF